MQEMISRTDQHPMDVCLQGQGDFNNYVAFLVQNSINSNQRLESGVELTFVVDSSDLNVQQLVNTNEYFNSMDSQALIDFGIVTEEYVTLYGEGITLYGEILKLYS